jgi:four helix bundle protein
MKVERFEDLDIWKMSRELCSQIYLLTNIGEFKKDFRFRSQIRASAGSVMDNIAEGFGRGGNKEFLNFLAISRGSIEETKSQLYRAKDVNYLTEDEFNKIFTLASSISRKISSLMIYLKSSELKGTRFNQSQEEDILYIPVDQPSSDLPE